MTSLRKRLNNVLAELEIIREALNRSGRYPSCCLTLQKNGKISCDVKAPLPKEQFLKECARCRAEIESFLANVRHRGPAASLFTKKTIPYNEEVSETWSKEIGLEVKVWAVRNLFKRGIQLRKSKEENLFPKLHEKERIHERA
jgi:hypothetical protein